MLLEDFRGSTFFLCCSMHSSEIIIAVRSIFKGNKSVVPTSSTLLALPATAFRVQDLGVEDTVAPSLPDAKLLGLAVSSVVYSL